MNKVKKIGNYSPSGHNAASIVDKNGLAPTVMENHGTVTAIEEDTLKKELCNKLVKEGKVKENDIVKHSYTKQILSGNKKAVEKQDEMITLTTRGDCLGVVVKDNTYGNTEKELFTKDGNIKRYLGGNKVDKFKEGQMATTTYPNGYGHGPRTHDESIALNTIDRPSVKKNLRIRKLVPLECLKLMGFTREDYEAMRKAGMSDAALYHVAGDSIIVTCLMGLFGELLGKDTTKEIEQYVEKVKES